jgi:hypothetical protein
MTSDTWKCRVFGHRDLNEGSARDPFVCKWCGGSDYYGEDLHESWHILAIRRFRFWLRDQWWSAKAWFGPCDYCGMICGKHDDQVDHIPF